MNNVLPTIPDGWRHSYLEDLVYLDREKLSEGTNDSFSFYYIDISAVSEGNLQLPATKISFRGSPSRARKVVRRGDVLMASVRPNLKAFAYFDHTNDDCIASTGFAVLTARSDVDPRFILASILSNSVTAQIESHVVGSNYPAINSKDIGRLQIPAPPPAEQRKIARILTTVDNLIEKTEALIAKYQAIKQGMMHDLFTRGVDEHGHLRPPYEEAPELYNPSELGWIPKEWEVRKLQQLYANPIRDFGSFSSTNLITFLEHGVPFIKSEMIEEGNVNWESVTYISAQVHRLLDKSHVHKGNILFSKIGSALGKGLVYDGSRGVCNSNAAVAKIEIDTRVAGRHFVTYFLNHDIAKVQLRNMIVSLLPRINLNDLSSLLIPTPTLEEQQNIEARFLSADMAIRSEKATLAHLFEVKIGLMQDLLTGKVRVKADEAEEVARV